MEIPVIYATALLKAQVFLVENCFLAVQWDAIFRSNNGSKFTVHTNMNSNIGLLRLFPGITAETVSQYFKSVVLYHLSSLNVLANVILSVIFSVC